VAGAAEELAQQRGRRGWRGGGAGGPAEWMDAELSAYAKKANGGCWMDTQIRSYGAEEFRESVGFGFKLSFFILQNQLILHDLLEML